MKAASLLFLRVSTGLLLMVWGMIRLGAPEAGVQISEKYYQGIVSFAALQQPWGAAQLVIGLLVCLGLFRRYVYPAQAVILCAGALAIWKYLLDPFGLYLLDAESRQVLFFPSLAVAAATLVLLAFRSDDRLSLDAKFRRP